MKPLSSLTLAILAVAGLTITPAAFNAGAIAATAQVKPAHQGKTAAAKRRRVARSACRPTGMYFGGQRVCEYPTPYTYRVDPDGFTTLLWPR